MAEKPWERDVQTREFRGNCSVEGRNNRLLHLPGKTSLRSTLFFNTFWSLMCVFWRSPGWYREQGWAKEPLGHSGYKNY